MSQSADEAWVSCLRDVVAWGHERAPRGKRTRELFGSRIVMDMTRPIVTIPARKLGYRFMCAEAAWIIEGRDDVASIAPFSKKVANFSDDGKTFFGAYGPKLRDQLDYVVRQLDRDPDTRQATFNIWRENPPEVKDYPCTLSCTFMIHKGMLNSFVVMRSNDVWLGTPYDLFSASMWSAYVLARLKNRYGLGELHHHAWSRHLYEENWAQAVGLLANTQPGFEYEPYHCEEFQWGAFDNLPKLLWTAARRETWGDHFLCHHWLDELPNRFEKDEGIRQ